MWTKGLDDVIPVRDCVLNWIRRWIDTTRYYWYTGCYNTFLCCISIIGIKKIWYRVKVRWLSFDKDGWQVMVNLHNHPSPLVIQLNLKIMLVTIFWSKVNRIVVVKMVDILCSYKDTEYNSVRIIFELKYKIKINCTSSDQILFDERGIEFFYHTKLKGIDL